MYTEVKSDKCYKAIGPFTRLVRNVHKGWTVDDVLAQARLGLSSVEIDLQTAAILWEIRGVALDVVVGILFVKVR